MIKKTTIHIQHHHRVRQSSIFNARMHVACIVCPDTLILVEGLKWKIRQSHSTSMECHCLCFIELLQLWIDCVSGVTRYQVYSFNVAFKIRLKYECFFKLKSVLNIFIFICIIYILFVWWGNNLFLRFLRNRQRTLGPFD